MSSFTAPSNPFDQPAPAYRPGFAPPPAPAQTFVAPSAVVVPIGTPLAISSLRRRVGAYAIDAVIAGVVQLIIASVGIGIMQAAALSAIERGSNPTGVIILMVVLIALASLAVPLVTIGLMPASQGSWNGRTIGKRVFGIRVVRVDGKSITLGRSLKRMAAFLGPIWVGYLAGLIIDAAAGTGVLFTFSAVALAFAYLCADIVVAGLRGEHRRSIHDRVAETVVVKLPSAFLLETTPDHDAFEDPYAQPRPAAAHLFVGRTRTPATWTLGISAGLLLVVLSLLMAYLVAFVGDTSSSGENPFSPAAPSTLDSTFDGTSNA